MYCAVLRVLRSVGTVTAVTLRRRWLLSFHYLRITHMSANQTHISSCISPTVTQCADVNVRVCVRQLCLFVSLPPCLQLHECLHMFFCFSLKRQTYAVKSLFFLPHHTGNLVPSSRLRLSSQVLFSKESAVEVS